jgi:anti-sigma factor RsiW
MNVTRDVILDLLPLYLAGEASDDTRALVDAYLERDLELARIAKQNSDLAARMAAPLTPLPKEHELKTLERTKTMLKLRSVLMAIAIFFTLLPMAGYQIGRHRWAMLSDFPAGAVACGVIALGTWVAYFSMKRKFSATSD